MNKAHSMKRVDAHQNLRREKGRVVLIENAGMTNERPHIAARNEFLTTQSANNSVVT